MFSPWLRFMQNIRDFPKGSYIFPRFFLPLQNHSHRISDILIIFGKIILYINIMKTILFLFFIGSYFLLSAQTRKNFYWKKTGNSHGKTPRKHVQ